MNNLFDFAFFQAFLSNAFATIIGVILGIPIALWLNSYLESSSERERKKKILQVLQVELLVNKKECERWGNSGDALATPGDMFALPPMFRFESWKAFSDGGEIQWIKDPELLGIISEAYYAMRISMDLSTSLFNIVHLKPKFRPETEAVEELIRKNLQRERSDTLDKVNNALESLDRQLNKS